MAVVSKRKLRRQYHDIKTCEELEDIPEIISKIIRHAPETSIWISLDARRTMKLQAKSEEFQDIARLFRGQTFAKKVRFDIYNIERIENPHLMAGFVLKRLDLIGMRPKIQVHTKPMFHATNREVTNKIITHGFDWKRAGEKRGDKWGHGVSFSPYSDFAAKFTQSDNHVDCMLMCYMLQRNVMIGNQGLDIPDDDYDTTRSTDGKVFVKYEDFTAYPAYRITYRKH